MMSALLLGIYMILISNGGTEALQNKSGANGNELIGQAPTIYAKLIHRDSLIPPSSTLDYSDDDYDDNFLGAQLSPFGLKSIFLVNISVGQPPVPQLLVLDTGSPITWVRQFGCLGCKEENIPFYISCSSELCPYHNDSCGSKDKCGLILRYAGQTNARVVIGTETFTFFTSDEGLQTVPNLVFGYAVRVGLWDGLQGVNGIFGLGPKIGSIINNYSKFSYCIGNLVYYKESNLFSSLIIGEGARTQGISMPMEINGYYLVKLVGITVGENPLDIVFSQKVIIDSGSPYTYLVDEAYNIFRKEVMRVMGGILSLDRNDTMLCYEGKLKNLNYDDFPLVALNFEGAKLVLELGSFFEQSFHDMICMSVKKATADAFDGMSLIGVMAQQNYNIGYDLGEKKVYIDKVDCQILEE